MKIELTDQGLKVNKWECKSVTIIKENDCYSAMLHTIKGITKNIPVINKYLGKQEKRLDGTLIFKTLRQTKKIKSKTFSYSGITLKEGRLFPDFVVYLHAINKNGEYINYYEK